MSWKLQFTGTRKAVERKIVAAGCEGDSTQFDRAKLSILTELRALPEECHVAVKATGANQGDEEPEVLSLSILRLPAAPTSV